MERDKKFKSLLSIQIVAIMLFLSSFFGTQAERQTFNGVSEFVPVNAKCVDSDRVGGYNRRSRSRRKYNNRYQYTVNGQKYVVTLYESSRGYDTILYHHPNNPQIFSEYRSYDDAKRHYSWFTNIGLILQGVVIFFVLRSLIVGKEKKVVQQSTGVVLNDDYDSYMKLENGQSDELQGDFGVFANKQEILERDSIPFVRKQETVEVESIPFVRKQDITQGDSIPFVRSEISTKSDIVSVDKESDSENNTYVLYTEEEYKKRK